MKLFYFGLSLLLFMSWTFEFIGNNYFAVENIGLITIIGFLPLIYWDLKQKLLGVKEK